jgi:ADP-ribosylglycohydrolase
MNNPVVRRIENALWGAFIGDALAMPVHWFCSTERIRERFPGGIDRYFPAPHSHPDAFMLGMTYQPDLEKAEASGRP